MMVKVLRKIFSHDARVYVKKFLKCLSHHFYLCIAEYSSDELFTSFTEFDEILHCHVLSFGQLLIIQHFESLFIYDMSPQL